MNYFTSIEQSKKLVELGIDPNTADMWYSLDDEDPEYSFVNAEEPPFEWEEITIYDRALPCWSTGALINLLPSELTVKDETYFLFIDVKCKTILYKSYNKYWQEFPSFVSDTFIDNIILVIKWLKENKYL